MYVVHFRQTWQIATKQYMGIGLDFGAFSLNKSQKCDENIQKKFTIILICIDDTNWIRYQHKNAIFIRND